MSLHCYHKSRAILGSILGPLVCGNSHVKVALAVFQVPRVYAIGLGLPCGGVQRFHAYGDFARPCQNCKLHT